MPSGGTPEHTTEIPSAIHVAFCARFARSKSRRMPSRCAKRKGGKSDANCPVVDKLTLDVDAKDWDSDGSEESSDVSSFSVEGAPVVPPVVVGDSSPVSSEDEMITESIGTFEVVKVSFSVSQPIWSPDGTLVSIGPRVDTAIELSKISRLGNMSLRSPFVHFWVVHYLIPRIVQMSLRLPWDMGLFCPSIPSGVFLVVLKC